MFEVWTQQSTMYCSYRRERKQTVSGIASVIAVWRLEGLAACKKMQQNLSPKTFQLFQMFEYQNLKKRLGLKYFVAS